VVATDGRTLHAIRIDPDEPTITNHPAAPPVMRTLDGLAWVRSAPVGPLEDIAVAWRAYPRAWSVIAELDDGDVITRAHLPERTRKTKVLRPKIDMGTRTDRRVLDWSRLPRESACVNTRYLLRACDMVGHAGYIHAADDGFAPLVIAPEAYGDAQAMLTGAARFALVMPVRL
jgi:hypothetical protein